MTRTHVKTVSIATNHDQAQLSKGQKAFNNLIKQIEKKRARLAAWEAAVPPYQQKYTSELIPLVESSFGMQVKMVHSLDRVSDQKGLTKPERRKIVDLITGLANQLLAERDDAELKAIYNKHSRSDYDSEEADAMQGMKSALEDMLDIELGDNLDNLSPEELLQRAKAQMDEKQAQEDTYWEAAEARRAKRKKSVKQLAQEAQQQAEAQQISQSIREVYRKLASALHPDRETDPQERERKTALMSRANQAYAKNNLLQLLELQLELEHIDQSSINNLSEERLKHYNKVLKEQLAELEQEIYHLEGRFRGQFKISPFVQVTPETLLRNLAKEISGIQHAIRELEKDLLVIEDIKKLKTWLKGLRRHSAMDFIYDCPF
ncbi:molecular chaperone DnaJ [Propionivibrio sp.]|uniref:molecular chaperone DnaJ n=1 Tax=Propionivibrio sp. TaxID=2212460 RepID=UPI003BF42102